jgi:hypothetical protein
VLLNNETNDGHVADSNFNSSIDVTLPPQDIIRSMQQQIFDALNTAQEKPAGPDREPQNEKEEVELSIDPSESGDEYTIDSLADVFPAHLPDDWGVSHPDYEENAQPMVETSEPVIEPIKPGEEFTFDTIPDISLDDPAGSTIRPLFPGNGPFQASKEINSPPPEDSAGFFEFPEGDNRPIDQGPPPFSTDMSDQTSAGMDFSKPVSDPAPAAESGVGREPAPAFSDTPETLLANSSSSAATAGQAEILPDMADQAPPFTFAEQKDPPPVFAGSRSIPVETGSEHFGIIPPEAAFADDIPLRDDFGKKSPLMLRLFVAALVLVISLAALFIVRDWLRAPDQDSQPVVLPLAPLPAPLRDLPAFIPGVTPDGVYAAAHPGWERREADGLEYLIYRENGRIRAIQVVAGAHGVISVPFLKTCIRETSGRESADNPVRENRNEIMIEKGTLPNKGELAVYRKMPEGDIRGFVLTFY